MRGILKKDFVYNQLRDDIRSGKMKPHQRLNGEIQLAEDFKVSRVTIRKALGCLENDQLIQRVQGKGTFVAANCRGVDGCFLAVASEEHTITQPARYVYPGIEKRLTESGIRLEHCSIQFIRSLDAGNVCALFRQNAVQGVFLMGSSYTGKEPEIAVLKASRLPVILPCAQHRDREIVDFAIMHSDDRLVFGDGIRYLASLGHQRIGAIFRNSHSPTDDLATCGFRLGDYYEFLKLNGLDSSPVLTKFAEYSRPHVGMAVRELMLGPKPPTAIACFSDFYAIHVYDALKELNIRIPEQVAVIGRCGYPGGRFLSPSLSTVDVMCENIGRMAAELMLNSDSWFGGKRPVTVITPHRVVARESTAATIADIMTGGKVSDGFEMGVRR